MPKIGQDLPPPIAKVCTFLSAHAVAKQFTLGKPSGPFASDARNTKERLKKAIGLTQESPHTRNTARSQWIRRTPQSWPLLVVRTKNVWPTMPKYAKPSKLRDNCGPGSGLNEDMGAYVKTSQWDPVFYKMAVT